MSIDKANAEGQASLHKISKRKVSIHSAGEGSGTGDLGGLFTPTSEQVAKINQFTKRTVTADDVIAFTANAMNNMYDRDDEAFTRQTVDEFAALPQPYSPIGKSYLTDHVHSVTAAKGRIFDVETKTIKGAHFLRPQIYTPKTAQYADFIENLDFGMSWAVSVGVVVDKAECSICSSPVRTVWQWSWCENGHEKGYFYVPGKEEKDAYGYCIPVDPSEKGAKKAQVDLKDPVDFYELSQVFLGAQLFAEIADKQPSIGKALKKAARQSIPIVGLTYKEAKGITMPHEPKEVTEARRNFTVTEDDDGTMKWTDESGVKWTWNPAEDDKVLCLGASDDDDDSNNSSEANADDEDTDDDDSNVDDSEDEDESDDEDEDEDSDSAKSIKSTVASWKQAIQAQIDDDTEGDLQELADAIDGLSDALDVLADDLLESLGMDEPDDDEGTATGTGTATAASAGKEAPHATVVMQAAVKAKFPKAIIESLASTDDETALQVLCSEAAKMIKSSDRKVKELEPRAVLGDQYVKEAEKTALHWFTVSRRDVKNPGKGVNVELAQKMIKLAGGDIETLKQLAADWKKEAEEKFPSATRRTAEPPDLEGDPEKLEEIPMDSETAAKVRKLHG